MINVLIFTIIIYGKGWNPITIFKNCSIMKRKISLKFSNEINDGGILFGIDRSDVINKLSLQTVISQNASIQVGYTSHNSSVDYFDENYPTLNLTINW